MAVDPEKFEKFERQVNDVIEQAPLETSTIEFIKERVIDATFDELRELINESRPPRLYVFGRSGAGKSSLINALANKEIAEVGNIEPTTVESEVYNITFPERNASWEVIDSRGLFESVTPQGEVPGDTVRFMEEDLEQYQPDILIHVITPDQVRAGKKDFQTVRYLRGELNDFPPVVYCLNKVDSHMSPKDD